MNASNLSSAAKMLIVAGLVVVAAGIVIQIAVGVDYPTIPPGLMIVLVAAGLIVFGPWWWTPVVGLVVGLFLLVGFFVSSGTMDRLTDTGEFGEFAGTAIQLVGVIVAIVAAGVATMRGSQARSRPRS